MTDQIDVRSLLSEWACIAAQPPTGYTLLMRLQEGTDFKRPREGTPDWASCDPAWLTGNARLTWDECVQKNQRPQVQWWHDGYGMYSGFNLIVPS